MCQSSTENATSKSKLRLNHQLCAGLCWFLKKKKMTEYYYWWPLHQCIQKRNPIHVFTPVKVNHLHNLTGVNSSFSVPLCLCLKPDKCCLHRQHMEVGRQHGTSKSNVCVTSCQLKFLDLAGFWRQQRCVLFLLPMISHNILCMCSDTWIKIPLDRGGWFIDEFIIFYFL